MTTTLAFEQQRAINDLLTAERQLREQSEKHVQDLRQLILETALRLDGERFEAIRREDPAVPVSWTVSAWRQFLRDIPSTKGWGVSVMLSNAPTQREQDLFQQVEALKSQLDEAYKQLESERQRSEIASRALAEMNAASRQVNVPANVPERVPMEEAIKLDIPVGTIPMQGYIIEDVRSLAKLLPKHPPAPFDKILDGGHRVGGDLVRVYQRYWMAVYLVGRWGLSASLEIEHIIAALDGVSSRSGSLRRILEDLTNSKIFVQQKLEMDTPRTALVVNRLSELGEKLYQALFNETPMENEWSQVLCLSNESVSEHDMAILFFTMHARKCGWMTRLFPTVPSEQPVISDVLVGRGSERYYVKMALERQEPAVSWKELANLNNGNAALCSSTIDLRRRLTGDCQLDHIAGMATDIETLVKMKYKIMDHNTDLWVEHW